jgi:thioredoxin reductase (NADPH)
MIGAVPCSDWIPPDIARDAKGFIRTGLDTGRPGPGRRTPFPLETSVPGIFAAGDVRAGSSKRVAAAVGEGAMAVQFIHRFLEGS